MQMNSNTRTFTLDRPSWIICCAAPTGRRGRACRRRPRRVLVGPLRACAVAAPRGARRAETEERRRRRRGNK